MKSRLLQAMRIGSQTPEVCFQADPVAIPIWQAIPNLRIIADRPGETDGCNTMLTHQHHPLVQTNGRLLGVPGE